MTDDQGDPNELLIRLVIHLYFWVGAVWWMHDPSRFNIASGATVMWVTLIILLPVEIYFHCRKEST